MILCHIAAQIFSMNSAHRFFILLFFFSSEIVAQTKQYRGAITIGSGSTQYAGDINNDWFQLRNISAFTSLSYSHYLNQRLDMRGGAAFGSWSYDSDVNNSFYADFFQATIDLRVKLRNDDSRLLMPFVFGGMGLHESGNWTLYNKKKEAIRVDQNDVHISVDDVEKRRGMLNVGLGLQIKIADRMFVVLEEKFIYTGEDAYDGILKNGTDNMFRHGIGIAFGLAPYVDMDHDGVEDKRDVCPGTPSVAVVDERGCPLDSDLDGIADFEDVCPSLPGKAIAFGCPDQDSDGVSDSEDECPLNFGLKNFNGCPDTDQDGIKDGEDRCPDKSGTLAMSGCPDSDGDGVADPDDKCLDTPENVAVDFAGCPRDADGDGVADYLDKCPGESGVAALNGCPEVKEEVIALFKKALNGIQFETGKDVITKSSWPILDSVVVVMNQNPTYKLKIAGHTDNQGEALKNLILSEQRAKAVMNYLVSHGVEPVRIISATGFGDQNPIADNSTKEGRKLNRRVEFEVEY
jgi:OOP family OmpA-OmpF porin